MSGARLVLDLPEDDYHQHPALSCSGAKLLLAPSCPAVYRWQADHRDQLTSTRPFSLGRAAHTLALGAGAPIVVVPEDICASNGALSTKEAKAFVTEHEAAGATVLKQADADTVTAMAAALKADPVAGRLFDHVDGQAEVSIFWTDDTFGVERRARLDWLPTAYDGPVVIQDYKTSTTAHPASFARKVDDYRYHQQHPWYADAVEELTGLRPAFVFVVQEKTPPYLVTVIQLEDSAVDLGRELNARALEVFRDCTDAGVWPGYSTEVELVDVPPWAYQRAQL